MITTIVLSLETEGETGEIPDESVPPVITVRLYHAPFDYSGYEIDLEPNKTIKARLDGNHDLDLNIELLVSQDARRLRGVIPRKMRDRVSITSNEHSWFANDRQLFQ